jgi:hypothetical protein
MALVTSVLDRIIPADDGLPGAGQAGIARHIDGAVGGSITLRRVFADGLVRVVLTSQEADSLDFEGLSNEQKDAVLRRVEAAEPDFFQQLVRQTYNGYYTDPGALAALGIDATPPQPRGHTVERGDLDLIERVKARGTAYRQV